MKREQVKKGEKIISALDKIEIAITECKNAIERLTIENYKEVDRGTADFDGGYNVAIAKYSDKSGLPVDMAGCYVQLEIYQATLEVLTKKKAFFEAMLESL